MNKRIVIIITIIICILLVSVLNMWFIPSRNEIKYKSIVYEELNEKIEEAKKSIVGIIPEEKWGSDSSYNGIGSGIIFDKNDNTYYVLTAKHVIEKENINYRLFTINTEFKGQIVGTDNKNIIFIIPDQSYYDSLINTKIEYVSDNSDLAILSFESDEELPVLEFETNKPKIGDKVVAIGHPEGEKYVVSYGNIISDLKTITLYSKGSSKKLTDKVIEHNAFINFGNSGGALLSENMKIIGINIGGEFSILRYFKKGFAIPYDIIEENINKWRKSK